MTAAEPQNVLENAPSTAAESAGATAFWLHVSALVVFYLTVVIAWGQRNSWPGELLLCVLSIPLSVLVASTIFATEGFGFAIEPEKSQQEQLIAALVLAVGLASGQVLLMSIGLVCLGIAWLRPARPGVDWSEWLKIPVIFLTALPFWLDFEGSRLAFARLFDDPRGNPVFHLPLALSTTQTRVLGYCGLLAMAVFLRGRGFWLALPCLPLFLAFTCMLPRLIPGWDNLPALLRAALPWLAGLAFLAAGALFGHRVVDASRWVVSGRTLRRWFEGRRYPPWLALMVIAVMQALPLQTTRFGPAQEAGLLGMAAVLGILLWLRFRTPKGPIHSRSAAMVAGGLALTLVAGFASAEPLRHLALACALIGLISWHCFWPLRIFVVAGFASFLLLTAPENMPASQWSPWIILGVRLTLGLILVVVLAWMARQPLPLPGAEGYGEEGWMPPKRFALILLALMMLFQTASAFWPEHEIDDPAFTNIAPTSSAVDGPSRGEPGWFQVPSAKGPVQMMIAYPRKNPYLLESPERTLCRRGWKVTARARAPHPGGEATALRIERDGVVATAMWWFELGDTAFSNHLYARRVLWSGWHLADRRLRLVRLESTALQDPQELIEIARREEWFAGFPPAHPGR